MSKIALVQLPKPYYQDEWVTIYHGDCRDILPSIRGISAVVTDPPYGLEFMGKEWDKFQTAQWKGEKESWQDKHPKNHIAQRISKMPRYFSGKTYYDFSFQWAELLLKACLPGAMLLSFGGTRTSHRIACAIEDAGWQIRDTICWVYGSGFPKSLDISKAIDKAKGIEREKIRIPITPHSTAGKGSSNEIDERPWLTRARELGYNESVSNKPATSEAKLWEGYGTALKPAYEPIIVAMKPLDGTFAENALKHKVAGLNIDECRIPFGDSKEEQHTKEQYKRQARSGARYFNQEGTAITFKYDSEQPKGRFPANLIHDGSQEVMELFPEPHGAGYARDKQKYRGDFGVGLHGNRERLTANRFGDNGSAARFFYCAKASRRERDAGLDDMPFTAKFRKNTSQWITDPRHPNGGYENKPIPAHNNHPTVKPLALMTYLCKLVKMPEYNLILDPFCGSGSTLVACKKLGIPIIGIDSDEKSCEIAAKRCQHG